ncbi:SH2 domain-containing protein 7 [Hemibagrus wyckioides]|nr:SH2 domain-containing protein 7 [Hemibagrus wyckioides]
MDFDYQKIKDDESRQREERISSFPVLQPRPVPRVTTATEAPSCKQKPPIKPRRSIKCRANPQPESGQSHGQDNQTENVERKRIAPSQVLNPIVSLDAQTPSLQAHNLLWFQRTQLPRLPKPVPSWLHGFATRREAEQLLQDKPQGCFLLRLSESKVGFVLSYRGADKCRHFIIDEECDASGTEGRYVIAGENSKHCSLEELINYYTHNPVGPFNERLTVACMQSNSSSEDKAQLDVRTKAETDEERVATPPCSKEYPPFSSDVQTAPESAQYAVVRKALRKSHSESECVTMLPLVQETTDTGTETENNTPDSVFDNTDICVGGDVAHPVDAPYARVNKPHRPTQPSSIDHTDTSAWGASAATESQSFPSVAAVAEQKYCELEPMHTYEEAQHTRTRENQIDFYAVGRHAVGENTRDQDLQANHVYSEVNIKGSRDDPMSASPPLWTGTTFISTQSSTRSIPRLPPRSNFRPAPTPARGESSTPNVGASAMRNPPLMAAESSEFSIYEQIPERPNKSRPPLPPLNSKR